MSTICEITVMGEQAFVVSAPGKIILHGEHAVVYGKKAVAASLNLRTSITLSVDNSAHVKLILSGRDDIQRFNVKALNHLKTLINGDPHKPEPLRSEDNDAIQEFIMPADMESLSIPDRIFLAFIFLWKSILNNFDESKGLNVKLDSQLPLAAGLGSSASVAVCLSAALLKVAGIIQPEDSGGLSPSHLELVNQWAFMVEKIFHGNPSGVDNCTCTYGGAVVYTNGSFNLKQMNLPMRILVVNSMVPRNTKELVANVRCKMEKYPTILNPILEAMGQVADVFQQTFWQDPLPDDREELYSAFEDLIEINQALLGSLGVSHPKLQEIICIASKHGLRAKLTGAGGGGVVFVLLRPETKAELLESVKEELTLCGFQHWDVTVGGPGVQIANSVGDHYSVWKHIACNKLQLPEDIAWMFFVAYRTLHRGRPEIRVQWDCHYAKRSATHERDHLKSLTTVDTLKFVLLLYLQLYNKITLKANSVLSLSSEEWPKLDSMTESVNRSTSRRALKILDEHHHQAFVAKKLVEMIDLLSDDKVRGETDDDRTVPLEAVEALSFIIEGSLDCNKSVLPLHDILMSPALHDKVGFVPAKKSFDLATLVTWIRVKLGFYPFGMSSCWSLGKQMPFGALGLENTDLRNGSMMANTASGPKGHKYVVLTRFTKQTIAKSSESLRGVGVRIHRCHNSYIYLLVPLKYVVITKCRDTTVVLGPVATTVVVAVCKGLRLISTCRRITISDCQSSIFHLLTPTPPVLIGNHNEAITLAPFHTTYPKLESHMVEVGIGHALNLWDSPLCLSDDGNLESQSCWRLLPADDFYIFNIPFEMEGNTKKIPGTPVPTYQTALKEKKHQVEAWHYLVKSANLDREQRDQLNKLVRARFQAWLILGGHQRELDGLMACAGPKHARRKEK